MLSRNVLALAGFFLFFAPIEAEDELNRSPQLESIGVGDGVADDTAAIQDAIDRGVGDIRLSKATYRITRPIVVDLDKVAKTSISGNGVAKIVMDGPGPAFSFSLALTMGRHHRRHFSELSGTARVLRWSTESKIVGNHPEASGIEASGTMQLTLTRVVVRDALHGVHLVTRNRNVTLSECHIYNNRGVGVFMDGPESSSNQHRELSRQLQRWRWDRRNQQRDP